MIKYLRLIFPIFLSAYLPIITPIILFPLIAMLDGDILNDLNDL